MKYYRCKCGKATAWSSMGVYSCVSCRDCGTTLAQSPSGHTEPKPHEYVTRYDEITGKPYERCQRCFQTRAEIESETEPEPAPSPQHPEPNYPKLDRYPHGRDRSDEAAVSCGDAEVRYDHRTLVWQSTEGGGLASKRWYYLHACPPPASSVESAA
jgi:hypothetical protein